MGMRATHYPRIFCTYDLDAYSALEAILMRLESGKGIGCEATEHVHARIWYAKSFKDRRGLNFSSVLA